MGSTLPYLKTNPKVIFFTDFDGTITLEDSKFIVFHAVSPVQLANDDN
jgi:2-hydroxy-3-keto-5-methylthiopentenyl-1-phosphate phosphatase